MGFARETLRRRMKRVEVPFVVVVAVLWCVLPSGSGARGNSALRPSDRSRAGEVIPEYEIAVMKRGIAVFTSIEAGTLMPPQVSMMGRVFRVRPMGCSRQFLQQTSPSSRRRRG